MAWQKGWNPCQQREWTDAPVDRLKELEKVLKSVSGHTAVFLFTDGTLTGGPTHRPIEVAERMVEAYDVCFYVISTANKEENEKLLEKVAAINACSRVVPFTNFLKFPTIRLERSTMSRRPSYRHDHREADRWPQGRRLTFHLTRPSCKRRTSGRWKKSSLPQGEPKSLGADRRPYRQHR